jgi:hypothetical protein
MCTRVSVVLETSSPLFLKGFLQSQVLPEWGRIVASEDTNQIYSFALLFLLFLRFWDWKLALRVKAIISRFVHWWSEARNGILETHERVLYFRHLFHVFCSMFTCYPHCVTDLLPYDCECCLERFVLSWLLRRMSPSVYSIKYLHAHDILKH